MPEKENNMKNEIDVLLSEKEIKINNNKIVVHKISLLDSIKFTANLSKVINNILEDSSLIASAITKLSYQSEDLKETNSIRLIGLTELLSAIGDDSVKIIQDLFSKTTNMADEDIEMIAADDGMDLLMAIYEINKNFFMKFMNKLQKKQVKKISKKTK